MKFRARAAAVLLGAAATVVPLAAGTAGAAYADNCEPTEPVVRLVFMNYEENILDERDNPLCYVLNGYVYPRLCDDSTTLLQNCLQTLNPDLDEPVVVVSYQPDGGRIVCTTSTFVLTTVGISGGSCTSATGTPFADVELVPNT